MRQLAGRLSYRPCKHLVRAIKAQEEEDQLARLIAAVVAMRRGWLPEWVSENHSMLPALMSKLSQLSWMMTDD